MKIKLRQAAPKIFIVYASVSGNTRRHAGRIANLVSKRCRVQMLDLETFKASDTLSFSRHVEDSDILVVLSSTAGNGEVPHQGRVFESCLEKGMFQLDQKPYMVLGFGSRKYPKFCEAGKRLDVLLQQCGGRRVHAVGMCDAANEVADFNAWCVSTLSSMIALLRSRGRPEKWVEMAMDLKDHFYEASAPKEPEITLELLSDEEVWQRGRDALLSARVTPSNAKEKNSVGSMGSSWMTATVLETRVLFGNPTNNNFDRATTLVRLDVSGSGQSPYVPGDHVLIMPELVSDSVDEAGKVSSTSLDVFCRHVRAGDGPSNPDQVFFVQGDRGSVPPEQYGLLHRIIGQHVTLRGLFKSVADIHSKVSIQACSQLANFASSKDKARLKKSGSDAHFYGHEVEISGMKWIHLFDNFPSLKSQISLEFLLRHIPLNHERYYSVSSSKAHVGNEIHLTVGRNIYTSQDETEHLGLASNYLTLMKAGALVKFRVKTASDFHMPLRPETPIIMIATGTGIAPFRGFWQERVAMKAELSPMMLLVGCRCKAEAEALYMDELRDAAEQGILTFSHVFSREPGQPKQYVQDLVTEKADCLRPLIHGGGAHVYVCGNANMASPVKDALRALDAAAFDAIIHKGAYHEDIFGA